jgi:hypothetical protein
MLNHEVAKFGDPGDFIAAIKALLGKAKSRSIYMLEHHADLFVFNDGSKYEFRLEPRFNGVVDSWTLTEGNGGICHQGYDSKTKKKVYPELQPRAWEVIYKEISK